MNKPTIEKGISDIVGVFTDPIIVFPGGWGDTLPDWIKSTITLERLIENMKTLKGEEMTGTDTEACAYLYTVSLTQPMDHDWTQIYLYIATKTYEKWRTKDSGVEMPADIRVDSLSDYQLADLRQLKDWIYQRRAQVRLDHDRAERRQRKEEESQLKKELQPALFDL
ncbi:unnamed protein product [marine sediment metagenome]|uniref:Uncharacterized protein n=1 Tax=marine sediment metagenome TaxID=412755 RepID=X1TD04_9ZZZZ